MPNIRTPLISGVTDQVQVRSKNYLPSAYAVGKVFTGVTLPPNINLDTYLMPGVSRVGTYVNGPPVVSPGYLVIHAVNQDEEPTNSAGYPSVKGVSRYRQIYYPDSLTETTPYTRVGESNSTTGVITWSTWTTMGGNWVCEILTSNKTAIVNYMYHSFGNWTLTLPDPTQYVSGAKIGLTQWLNRGKVVWSTNEQETISDISEEGSTIGALQYIFQIVPNSSGVNIWALDVDNNINGTINTLTSNFQSQINNVNNTITTLTNRVKTEEETRAAEDTLIRNEFRAADADIKNTLTPVINRKQPLLKHLATSIDVTFIANASASNPESGNNLEFFDYIVVVNDSCTVTLPVSTNRRGAHITIMVAPGRTVTVTWPSTTGTVTEGFQNTNDAAQLVVDLMAHNNSTGTNNWTVLEVG